MKLGEEKSPEVWKAALQYAVKENMTIAFRADTKVECSNLVILLGCIEVENLKVDGVAVRAKNLILEEFHFVILRMKSFKQVRINVILSKVNCFVNLKIL